MPKLDPITLEVLRQRLMMINDEQGRVASRLSGSPVVYEAKDFNSALLTPDGESLFIGVYMTRLSLCLSAAVKTVIARYGDSMGFRDGDAFVTNDPWAGAVHMNDILMFAPVFAGETLVCWTGLAMHEVDVGGPNPGSFTVGTPDVYGEAPLIPPLKMIDAGVLRPDVEALVIRNSRTPELNGLDMRARIAAINRTRQRIGEVVIEYGLDALMEAQQRIIELTGASFARRLLALPDGKWRSQGFIDHDGNENRLYRIALEMTKSQDRLKFDFTGTDKQARGAINCTRVGLESGVFSAILPMLCFDIPWSPAGIMPLVEIVSEEGTINNARHPAAVSMATVQATFATSHVTYAAIAKMIAASGLKREIQANWVCAWHGMTLGGSRADGRPFTAVLLDTTGGSGARGARDGIDAAGVAGAPAMAIGNVETYEKENPILYVYRSLARDTGGQGFTRGGAGMQALIVPHGVGGDTVLTSISHGVGQPESPGLLGGAPSSVQLRLVLRHARLPGMFAAGKVPVSHDEIACARVDVLEAKQRTAITPDDAVLTVCAGGAGYGDAIDRAPAAVLTDVLRGLVSRRVAREIYGVEFTGSAPGLVIDDVATAARRREIRAERLREGIAVNPSADERPEKAGRVTAAIGEALVIVETANGHALACKACHHPLSDVSEDPKSGAIWREIDMRSLSDWNEFGQPDRISVREYCCPSCAHLIAIHVGRKDEAHFLDQFLAPPPGTKAAAAE